MVCEASFQGTSNFPEDYCSWISAPCPRRVWKVRRGQTTGQIWILEPVGLLQAAWQSMAECMRHAYPTWRQASAWLSGDTGPAGSLHALWLSPADARLLWLLETPRGAQLSRLGRLVAPKRCDLQNASVCDLVAFVSWRRCDLKRCDLEARKERGQRDLGNCVPKRSVSSCDLRFKIAI